MFLLFIFPYASSKVSGSNHFKFFLCNRFIEHAHEKMEEMWSSKSNCSLKFTSFFFYIKIISP